MLEILFKKVCNGCDHVKPYIDEHEICQYGGGTERVITTIGCEHEKVCVYLQSEPVEESCYVCGEFHNPIDLTKFEDVLMCRDCYYKLPNEKIQRRKLWNDNGGEIDD